MRVRAGSSKLGVTVALAAILGIAAGCLVGWLIFSTHLPERLSFAGLVPTATSLLVFSGVTLFVLNRSDVPMGKFTIAFVCGFLVVLLAGAVLIEMVGCRFDACINL